MHIVGRAERGAGTVAKPQKREWRSQPQDSKLFGLGQSCNKLCQTPEFLERLQGLCTNQAAPVVKSVSWKWSSK